MTMLPPTTSPGFRHRVEQELNRVSDQFVGPRWFTNANYGNGIVSAFTPRAFGAAGDGVTDDSAPIQACLDAAGASARNPAFYGMPVVDFEGLSYATSVQLEIPGSYGLTLKNGALHWTAGFADTTKFLLATGRSSDTNLQSGFKLEHFIVRDMFLDSKHVGGGLLIQNYNRGIVDHVSVTGYSTYGLKTQAGAATGHELFITNSQFGEYFWGDTSGTGYSNANLFVGTGVELNTPDNHMMNCVVSLSKIGIKVTTQANMFSQIHIWTGYVTAGVAGPTATLTTYNTGLWITASATFNTFNQMYMDGSEVLWEDPWRTSFTNSQFLQGWGDASRAFIRFKPMGASRSVTGVVLTGNTFQVQASGLMKMAAVDTSVGTFSATVTNCRITDNNFSGATNPVYTHIRAALSQNASQDWNFDFTGMFPFGGVIQTAQMTDWQFSGGSSLLRISALANFTVTVSSYPVATPSTKGNVNATVYLDVSCVLKDA